MLSTLRLSLTEIMRQNKRSNTNSVTQKEKESTYSPPPSAKRSMGSVIELLRACTLRMYDDMPHPHPRHTPLYADRRMVLCAIMVSAMYLFTIYDRKTIIQ